MPAPVQGASPSLLTPGASPASLAAQPPAGSAPSGPLPLSAVRPVLHTPRLHLVGNDASLGPAVAAFVQRNRAHLAPWDPPTPEAFFTEAAQTARVHEGMAALAAGTAFRYWLTWAERPGEVIGSIHFSQVARGAFHNAMLGYALDAECQGLGLMTEALQAGIAEMFSPRVNLHRLQAAYRPENTRSGAVLARLGFEDEGLARHYLYIAGAWRDHRITALRNPAFRCPAGWANAEPAPPPCPAPTAAS